MSDDKVSEPQEAPEENTSAETPGEKSANSNAQSGPNFTKSPDPLAGVKAGVKKGATDVLDSMEGKTVSMKVYVASIIGVIVLMMLARCGG